jgi:hypothetical protein
LRPSLFWDITRRLLVVLYLLCTFCQALYSDCFTLEDGTIRLFRNVDKQLRTYAALTSQKSGNLSCTAAKARILSYLSIIFLQVGYVSRTREVTELHAALETRFGHPSCIIFKRMQSDTSNMTHIPSRINIML